MGTGGNRGNRVIGKLVLVMDTTKIKPLFLTIEEVALLLRKKERTIREWCYAKTIPHYKVGRSLRFRLDEIMDWLQKDCRIEVSSFYLDGNPSRKSYKKTEPPKLEI